MKAKNIILVTLDSVRQDFFNRARVNEGFEELRKDFVDFRSCSSIYTDTCTSHYTIFFGDYYNRSENESFPDQLNRLGFKSQSYCNCAIFSGYPLKGPPEKGIENTRPYRNKMIEDLGVVNRFNWDRFMFGSKFEDYQGAADDEGGGIPKDWKEYFCRCPKEGNFLFLHFWKAHYIYEVNEFLENPINGEDYHIIGRELIRQVKSNLLTKEFVKGVYSIRIEKLISIYLKELIQTLKENNLYKDTLIIITADHGEGLGDIGRKYPEQIINISKPVLRYYNMLRALIPSIPEKSLCYTWDYETYYHGGNHELQKKIPLMIKFPNEEFGGAQLHQTVTLFDIIHTIDHLLNNSLNIQKNYGASLHYLLQSGKAGREKYKIKRSLKKKDNDLSMLRKRNT